MRLSEPTQAVRESLATLEGDLIVLGAGGKMGPSFCHMARRASGSDRRIFAVSRFTDPCRAAQLAEWGIEVIQGDLARPPVCGDTALRALSSFTWRE